MGTVYLLIEADDAQGHHSVGDALEIDDAKIDRMERLGIVSRRKPKPSKGDD